MNGVEFLMVHKEELYDEIEMMIHSVDAEACRSKTSETGQFSYNPEAFNSYFKTFFKNGGWKKKRECYWLTKRVAVEIQFEENTFEDFDLFSRHLSCYISDHIDVGIEILPMKALQAQMSSGVPYYEGELYNVIRQGRGVPAVPLVIIGVLP